MTHAANVINVASPSGNVRRHAIFVLPFQTRFRRLNYSNNYLSRLLSGYVCLETQTRAELHFCSTSMIFHLVRLIMETLIRVPRGDSDPIIKTYSACRAVSSLAGSREGLENLFSSRGGWGVAACLAPLGAAAPRALMEHREDQGGPECSPWPSCLQSAGRSFEILCPIPLKM